MKKQQKRFVKTSFAMDKMILETGFFAGVMLAPAPLFPLDGDTDSFKAIKDEHDL
jgi:hypothetical protein